MQDYFHRLKMKNASQAYEKPEELARIDWLKKLSENVCGPLKIKVDA